MSSYEFPAGERGEPTPSDQLAEVLPQAVSEEEILDALPDPVFLCDREGKVLYWNRPAREVAGASTEETEPANLAAIVPEHVYPELEETLEEVADSGSGRVEIPMVTGRGQQTPFEVRGSLIGDTGDELICGVARDVSERKVREEDLRRREELVRLLVEQEEEYAIVELGPEGRVATWNEGAERITGYSQEDVLNEHFSTFYREREVEAGLPARALQIAEEEGQWLDEGWRVRKDGARFWARVAITALRNVEGELQGFAVVTRDMTARRRWDEKLRQSEKRYRRLFEESQEGIAITTPKGEIVDANRAALQILGYEPEDLEDLNELELYVDEGERQRVRTSLAREGAVRRLDVRMQRKDGTEIVCQISTTPRRGPAGKIQVFQTFFRDVTEQRRTQEALRRSERRYRRLFEESRDAVVLTTVEGDILDANRAAEELFGYSKEELLRLSAEELYAHPDERRERILPALEDTTSSELLEMEMRHKDGDVFVASASATVHRNEEGEVELIQALVRDITERRRLERDVLHAQEQERRRLGQDLHDGVASQLGAIAITLSSAIEVIDDSHPAHERVNRAHELVQESTQDVRRLSRGLSPVHLSEAGLTSALERLAENTDSCEFEYQGDLAPLSDRQKTHLYWIAQEAVTNARKYAEADVIDLRLSCADGETVLQVEDDGQGFDAAEYDDCTLGLRTMRYRAELIGGEFVLESHPGEGTFVECRLCSEARQSVQTQADGT